MSRFQKEAARGAQQQNGSASDRFQLNRMLKLTLKSVAGAPVLLLSDLHPEYSCGTSRQAKGYRTFGARYDTDRDPLRSACYESIAWSHRLSLLREAFNLADTADLS